MLKDLGSWSDALRGHKDVPGIHNGTNNEVGYENQDRKVIHCLHMNTVKDKKRVAKLRVEVAVIVEARRSHDMLNNMAQNLM